VAEEAPQPIRVHTDVDLKAGAETLISVDTPRPSGELPVRSSLSSDKENKEKVNKPSNLKSPVTDASELKTVEI
jgi:hypothetical protein